MLLVRICWGPARGRFAGSGGFGFRILDFEFVWDFDIGISDFPFWLRAQPALGVRVRVRVGLHAVCLTRLRAAAGSARPRLHEACERLSVKFSTGIGMNSVVQCEANAQGSNRRSVVTVPTVLKPWSLLNNPG